MPHGCQKRIYYMKNPQSKYFAEAYLILKNNISSPITLSSCDLAAEAERIVREACGDLPPAPKRGFRVSRAGAFVLGAASSSALIGTLALLITFG